MCPFVSVFEIVRADELLGVYCDAFLAVFVVELLLMPFQHAVPGDRLKLPGELIGKQFAPVGLCD